MMAALIVVGAVLGRAIATLSKRATTQPWPGEGRKSKKPSCSRFFHGTSTATTFTAGAVARKDECRNYRQSQFIYNRYSRLCPENRVKPPNGAACDQRCRNQLCMQRSFWAKPIFSSDYRQVALVAEEWIGIFRPFIASDDLELTACIAQTPRHPCLVFSASNRGDHSFLSSTKTLHWSA